MSTSVKVSIDDVVLISAVGRLAISTERDLLVDMRVSDMMPEKRWSWRSFGYVPRYASREEAIEALKNDGNEDFFDFGVSSYMKLTRYHRFTEYNRLKRLREMAMSSIDGELTVGSDDHELLKRYAPAMHSWKRNLPALPAEVI